VRRLAKVPLAVVPLVLVLLSGCGVPTMADLPLPGGAATGPAYRVTVEFGDVLDLVPHSAVKVNDVTVGEVEEIALAGWTARVRIRVAKTIALPDNATAAVRQTSLLGEKFVALEAPVAEPASGALSEGDVIPLTRTRRTAEVEEVLAAFGLLLNGGGLTNLRTITHELSVALDGNEAAARGVLRQLDTFIGGLDARRAEIGRAIAALDRLLAKLAAQRETIGNAMKALAPGLTVLADQRADLVAALKALGDLGTVGTRVVNASRDELVATLRALQPTLDQLVKAGANLPRAMDSMFTIVFPPNVTNAIRNGYINLHADVLAGNGRAFATANARRGNLAAVLEGGVRE
jgi:phospholipid/cholesterol/gamma-HCH transport system substrate-binding protein